MSVESLNLSGVRVDEDTGRVSLTGLQSGIDSGQAVSDIINARRIPIDRIERQIEENQLQITTLDSLSTLMRQLQDQANQLYGALSVDDADDLFESKAAFAGTTRTDGGTATDAASLFGVTLSNTAETGSVNFQILQRATRDQVTQVNEVSLTADNLVTADGFFYLSAGTVPVPDDPTIPTVEVRTTDTIRDVRDKINAVTSDTGVSARVVETSAGNGRLVISAEETNQQLFFNNGTLDTVPSPVNILNQLGIVDANNFVSVISTASAAQIQLNDVPDPSLGLETTAVATNAEDIGDGTAFTFALANPGTVVGTSTTLDSGGGTTLADYLTDGTLTATGVNNADGNQYFAKQIGTDGGDNIILVVNEVNDADSGGVQLNAFAVRTPTAVGALTAVEIEDLTIREGIYLDTTLTSAANVSTSGFAGVPLVVERDSNTIDDIFEGVTLDLLAAEAGTDIELDIQNDLATVKSGIISFVEAFNEVKRFLNQQRDLDPGTGQPTDEAVLYGTGILSQIEAQFGLITSSSADGFNINFSALSEIGIEFVDNETLTDQLDINTLEIDDATLDNALLNDFDDVAKLFRFEFTSDDSRVSIVGFDGTTQPSVNGVEVDFATDGAGNILLTDTLSGAALDFEQAGNVVEILSGDLSGLRLFFDEDLTAASGPDTVLLRTSTGVGFNFFFGLEDLLEDETGLIDAEIDKLEDVNEFQEERVEEQLDRLDRERDRLIAQFNTLEAALASLESRQQQIAAAFGQSE